MAYNKILADRIREALKQVNNVDEIEKMGGLSFMVNRKVCVRVHKNDMLLRCDPEGTHELLTKSGARRFEMKGKSLMKGWLLISPEVTNTKRAFDYWIDLALDFNKKLNDTSKRK